MLLMHIVLHVFFFFFFGNEFSIVTHALFELLKLVVELFVDEKACLLATSC